MEANIHLCGLVEKQVVLVPERKGTFPRGVSEGLFVAGVMAFMGLLLRSDFGEKGTRGIIQSTRRDPGLYHVVRFVRVFNVDC